MSSSLNYVHFQIIFLAYLFIRTTNLMVLLSIQRFFSELFFHLVGRLKKVGGPDPARGP